VVRDIVRAVTPLTVGTAVRCVVSPVTERVEAPRAAWVRGGFAGGRWISDAKVLDPLFVGVAPGLIKGHSTNLATGPVNTLGKR
jgi:hypothetical protein